MTERNNMTKFIKLENGGLLNLKHIEELKLAQRKDKLLMSGIDISIKGCSFHVLVKQVSSKAISVSEEIKNVSINKDGMPDWNSIFINNRYLFVKIGD
jgi:hypothetical protein